MANTRPMHEVIDEHLQVLCGQALIDHYAVVPHQTFHHEPSVAAVVLDAVPEGWAKLNGDWVLVTRADHDDPEGIQCLRLDAAAMLDLVFGTVS